LLKAVNSTSSGVSHDRLEIIKADVMYDDSIVAFLVSDDAHWLTGQNIQVNGGIL
jgi:NAD(P)-dependent dehydrogenase (short-subunit alcohol dehydrogenase family)